MDEYLKIFEPILKKYFRDVDMGIIMCYMIDIVKEDALPYLADQFNVSGIRGYDLCETVDQKRELIKSAISIMRKVGTPYSIKQALKKIGFPNVVILERTSSVNKYDAVFDHSGLIQYNGGADGVWVNFDVVISVNDPNAITEIQKANIRLMIDEYKPKRSILINLTFNQL